jgi:O-antigen/teichoic acid export membrane protein
MAKLVPDPKAPTTAWFGVRAVVLGLTVAAGGHRRIVNRLPAATRQSILMLTTRASLLGLGFGNTILTARLLQPAGRGTYATIMAALNLVVLLIGSLGSGVALSAAHDEAEGSYRTTSASIGMACTIGLLPLLVFLAWHPRGDWHDAAVVAVAGTPFLLLTNYVQYACMGRGRFGWFAMLQILQPALLVVLGVLLMIGLRLGLFGAMVAWTLSWIVTASIAVCALVALGWRLRIADLLPWRSPRLISFGAGASFYNALTYFPNRSLLFVVQVLLGSSAAGIYSVTMQLAEPVNSMSGALATVAYPRLASSPGRPSEARRFLQTAATISIVGGGTILALALVLLVPIFGREYQAAIIPLPLLLLAYVILSGREIAALWYVHEHKSYAVPIRAAAAAFLVTLAVGILLVRSFGTVGAACAVMAGSATLMTVLLAGLRKRGFMPSSLLRLDPAALESVSVLINRRSARRLVIWIRTILGMHG